MSGRLPSSRRVGWPRPTPHHWMAIVAEMEHPNAETTRPQPVRLLADRRTQRLQLAGWQAARLLYRAQHRALRVRRWARHGSRPQRSADDAQLRVARLWQSDRQLA